MDVKSLIKIPSVSSITERDTEYYIYMATPAVGVLYLANNFLSGHVRMRGKDEGRYPYHYLEMIDNLFGLETNTIEVCSRNVKGCFTVDIDKNTDAHLVDNGEFLHYVRNGVFNRWRCDPPYNAITAMQMYGTPLPSPLKLLTAGARVCKPNSLMFLLLGPTNYQWCPEGVKRIGLIFITIVPNNEVRCLNIYYKKTTLE